MDDAAPAVPSRPAASSATVFKKADPPPAPGDPSVHLEKTGPSSVNLGQPVTYRIAVRNVGPVAVGQVRVEDRLPNGARYRGADPKPEVNGEFLVWDLGDLGPGEERQLRVEIEPTTEGLLQSSAKVTYSSATGVQTHITRPRLTVTKTGPELVPINDSATFHDLPLPTPAMARPPAW